MTTKDGLDFEAIARDIEQKYKLWNDNHGSEQSQLIALITQALKDSYADGIASVKNEWPVVATTEQMDVLRKECYERGLAEGLKKSVVAKVPNFKLFENFLSNSYSYEDDYQWLISQIKAVELKMPERRHLDDSVLANKYSYFGNEGFNDALDEIEQMNPELFGEKE